MLRITTGNQNCDLLKKLLAKSSMKSNFLCLRLRDGYAVRGCLTFSIGLDTSCSYIFALGNEICSVDCRALNPERFFCAPSVVQNLTS